MSYVVIFRSTRNLDDGYLYSEWSEKMENLVKTIDGYEHHFGFRDSVSRDGVTVSYFTSLEAISQWKNLGEHKMPNNWVEIPSTRNTQFKSVKCFETMALKHKSLC